jgi:peptidyl-tRNA hydrolase, PTH1 family
MIIVGLGNPGKEYIGTRHNVGFMVLDKLAADLDLSWKKEFGVEWTKSGEHWLIKPQEFMNVSGASLLKFLKYKGLMNFITPMQLAAGQMIVINDDVDFPLEKLHEQSNRSAAGHNGVQSIIDTLDTQNFARLRIGIGNNRELNIPAEDYVLQKFNIDETKIIDQTIDRAVSLLKSKIQA